MIKDVLVNLDVDSDDTQAATFAISVASAFEAHLSAIAFAYNEFLPRILFGRATAQIVEQELREWEAAAVGAASKFEETARGIIIGPRSS